jgi:two-component system chemotaxis sensor kinase CheA
VVELVRHAPIPEHRIERIKDTAVLRLRNKLLPLKHLKKLLKIDDGSLRSGERFYRGDPGRQPDFGIVVDGVFRTEEIVVKPMSTKLRHIDMFSGNTILGDGAVIMIIDPNGVAKALGAGSASHEIARRECGDARQHRQQLTSLWCSAPAPISPRQCRCALVTRLEEIAADKIELSNGRHMVQYRDQLMPLVKMDGVKIATSGAQPILVFADDGRSMGLVVGRSSTSSRKNSISRSPAARKAFWARRDQGPGHRGDRRRSLPPWRSPTGSARRKCGPQPRRNRCCWSTTPRSSAICWHRC